MKINSIDSKIYIYARNGAFATASVISLILNIIFFQGLDDSARVFMLMFSLTLEISKICSVTSFNILKEIISKIKEINKKRLNKKELSKFLLKPKMSRNGFMFVYVAFALLSITASLGYSTMVTGRTENSISNRIERTKENIDKLNKLDEESRMSKSEWTADVKARYNEKQDEADKLNSEYRRAVEVRNNILNSLEEGVITKELNEATTRVNTTWSEYDTARRAAERANAQMSDVDKEFDIRQNEIKIQIEDIYAITELENPTTTRVIEYFDDELKSLTNKAGMAITFDKWSVMLTTTPDNIKFIILIILSLLLETTIFVFSPDIKLTRKVLYFFRGSLPDNCNIKELLNFYDKEYIQYSDVEISDIKTDVKIDKIDDKTEKETKNVTKNTSPSIAITIPKENDKSSLGVGKEIKDNIDKEVVKIMKNIKETSNEVSNEVSNEINQETMPAEQNEVSRVRQSTEETKSVYINPENTPFENKLLEEVIEKVNGVNNKKNEELTADEIDKIVPVIPKILEKKEYNKQIEFVDENLNKEFKKVVEKKNEEFKKEHVRPEIESIVDTTKNLDKSLKNYRFGTTTEKIKSKLVEFINYCINDRGEFKNNPDDALRDLQLNVRTKDVFLNRLSKLLLGDKYLIEYDLESKKWISNFDTNTIINYATELS